MNNLICAVISKNEDDIYTVENLIVFNSLSAIQGVKDAFGYEYLLPVDDRVLIGDIYDPEKDIYTRNGERIYPAITDKERIDALEAENKELKAQVEKIVNTLSVNEI